MQIIRVLLPPTLPYAFLSPLSLRSDTKGLRLVRNGERNKYTTPKRRRFGERISTETCSQSTTKIKDKRT